MLYPKKLASSKLDEEVRERKRENRRGGWGRSIDRVGESDGRGERKRERSDLDKYDYWGFGTLGGQIS